MAPIHTFYLNQATLTARRVGSEHAALDPAPSPLLQDWGAKLRPASGPASSKFKQADLRRCRLAPDVPQVISASGRLRLGPYPLPAISSPPRAISASGHLCSMRSPTNLRHASGDLIRYLSCLCHTASSRFASYTHGKTSHQHHLLTPPTNYRPPHPTRHPSDPPSQNPPSQTPDPAKPLP